MTKIIFTDLDSQESQTIDVSNGKLSTSDEGMQFMIDSWVDNGGTEKSFIEKFSDWNNGYQWSKLEEDTDGE